jgi:hypothetical protein
MYTTPMADGNFDTCSRVWGSSKHLRVTYKFTKPAMVGSTFNVSVSGMKLSCQQPEMLLFVDAGCKQTQQCEKGLGLGFALHYGQMECGYICPVLTPSEFVGIMLSRWSTEEKHTETIICEVVMVAQ